MEKVNNMKALYIIINAGFADEVVEIATEAGAKGATIMNARGTGAVHKAVFGISIDAEKEIILSLMDLETAVKVVAAIKEKMGLHSPANGICFMVPVDKMVGINTLVPEEQD